MLTPDKEAAKKMDNFCVLEESLLRLMGCPESPSDSGGLLVHFLVQPTFFTPGCVTFDVTKSAAVATLAILQRDQLNSVYSAFISKDREEWATFPLAPMNCFREVANIPEEMVKATANIGAFLDASELQASAKQCRDGAVYFVRTRGVRSQDIWLHNPESEDMPTHLGMLKSIEKIGMATFWREPANSYLYHLFKGGRR